MPNYSVRIVQTYIGEIWADNEEELHEIADASQLTFDSEELEEWHPLESEGDK